MEIVKVIEKGRPITIAVFSDTHGRTAAMLRCARRTSPAAAIHLGDHANDVTCLDLPCFHVRGNCDISGAYQQEMLLEIGGKRVFITHGHAYGVKNNPRQLIERAKTLGAVMALYGHTHIADIYNDGLVIAANPGSLCEPRGFQRPCFGLLTYDGNRLDFNILEYK